MKCEDCLILLEEYFDAELDARHGRQVDAHLAACATCTEFFRSLQQEQNVYAHYRRDVEVSPALWDAIQATIKQESATLDNRPVIATESVSLLARARRFFAETFAAPRFSPALAALLVIVAVGATVAVMKFLQSSPTEQTTIARQGAGQSQPENSTANANASNNPGSKDPDKGVQKSTAPEQKDMTPAAPAPKNDFAPRIVKENTPRLKTTVEKEPLVAGSDVTAEKLLRDAERKYLTAISILQRNFNKRRSQLDAGMVARLDAALNSIDNTIAETKKAMRQNPSDPIALQYMLSAYAKKVEVLRDVTTD